MNYFFKARLLWNKVRCVSSKQNAAYVSSADTPWFVHVQVSCGTFHPKTIWSRNWPGRPSLIWPIRSLSPCRAEETLTPSSYLLLRRRSSTTPRDASGVHHVSLSSLCVCNMLLCWSGFILAAFFSLSTTFWELVPACVCLCCCTGALTTPITFYSLLFKSKQHSAFSYLGSELCLWFL